MFLRLRPERPRPVAGCLICRNQNGLRAELSSPGLAAAVAVVVAEEEVAVMSAVGPLSRRSILPGLQQLRLRKRRAARRAGMTLNAHDLQLERQ